MRTSTVLCCTYEQYKGFVHFTKWNHVVKLKNGRFGRCSARLEAAYLSTVNPSQEGLFGVSEGAHHCAKPWNRMILACLFFHALAASRVLLHVSLAHVSSTKTVSDGHCVSWWYGPPTYTVTHRQVLLFRGPNFASTLTATSS